MQDNDGFEAHERNYLADGLVKGPLERTDEYTHVLLIFLTFVCFVLFTELLYLSVSADELLEGGPVGAFFPHFALVVALTWHQNNAT